jgi:ribosomal protein S18 acetylase RimI-like enzyme
MHRHMADQEARGYFHLAVLGTEPTEQRKGWGATVLRPMLDYCDAEGLCCYLENSNPPRNTAFYESQGFRTVERVDIGEPDHPRRTHVLLMRRDPRPAAAAK